jgi:hypothetical protein
VSVAFWLTMLMKFYSAVIQIVLKKGKVAREISPEVCSKEIYPILLEATR